MNTVKLLLSLGIVAVLAVVAYAYLYSKMPSSYNIFQYLAGNCQG